MPEGGAMGSTKPEDVINIIAAGLIKYSTHWLAEKAVCKLIVVSQKTEVHKVVTASSNLKGRGDLHLSC